MARFGFYRAPQIGLPSKQVRRLGARRPRPAGRLLPQNGRLDPARTAIGQYTLQVTPLQMAMVAGADRERRRADGAASLVDRVVDPDGRRSATRAASDGRAVLGRRPRASSRR